MMPEPLLAPFPEESVAEEMVSFREFRNISEIDLSFHSRRRPLAMRGHAIAASAMGWFANGRRPRAGLIATSAGTENLSAPSSGTRFPIGNLGRNRRRHGVRSGSGMRWNRMQSWGRKGAVRKGGGRWGSKM